MVDKNIALELYNQGYTLQKIGDRFNVSRQRIWQILKRNYALIKNHHEKKAIYNSNSRPSELYMIGKLFKLGYKVEPQPYNHPFDFLVNGKKVEMKY